MRRVKEIKRGCNVERQSDRVGKIKVHAAKAQGEMARKHHI
jgi:hypothetical protein